MRWGQICLFLLSSHFSCFVRTSFFLWSRRVSHKQADGSITVDVSRPAASAILFGWHDNPRRDRAIDRDAATSFPAPAANVELLRRVRTMFVEALFCGLRASRSNILLWSFCLLNNFCLHCVRSCLEKENLRRDSFDLYLLLRIGDKPTKRPRAPPHFNIGSGVAKLVEQLSIKDR